MTKEEYLRIKNLPISSVTWEQMREGEKLIQDTTISSAKKLVDDCCPKPLAKFLVRMLKEFYGTVEVDELLMELKLYPDWGPLPNLSESKGESHGV